MEKQIDINAQKCTGCTACGAICPCNAIEFKENDKGFKRPEINLNQCISCGFCREVCPIENSEFNKKNKGVYAFKYTEEDRKDSTSGGFFSYISDYVLKLDGVVYGAIFDDKFRVVHARATNYCERNRMRQSKYVQSDIGTAYKELENDLRNGRIVCFTGTPCQVSGLNNYLKKKKIDTKKLITCDFICHGTPSPLIWRNYLEFIENKYNDTIVGVNFRDKTEGWHKPKLKIKMEKNIQSLNELQDPFYQLFYSNCIMRDSCYECEYTRKERVSDFTMGDCWGIEEFAPAMDDNKGISVVLVNTEKGRNLLSVIESKAWKLEISIDKLKQPHLSNPVKMSRRRNQFWIDFQTHSYLYIIKKYGNYSISKKIINWIIRQVVRVIRK